MKINWPSTLTMILVSPFISSMASDFGNYRFPFIVAVSFTWAIIWPIFTIGGEENDGN